jgi:hypothetical protein
MSRSGDMGDEGDEFDEDELDEDEFGEDGLYAPLFTAIRAGDTPARLRAALAMVKVGGEGIDYVPCREAKNALALACELGDVPLVETLLAEGASAVEFSLGSKVFNTYKPLFFASLADAEKAAREDIKFLIDRKPAPRGGTQQLLSFGAGGVGCGPPPPPLPPAADAARRETIVKLLVAKGAGIELDVKKRPTQVGGWEEGEDLPVFSAAQAELIARALV